MIVAVDATRTAHADPTALDAAGIARAARLAPTDVAVVDRIASTNSALMASSEPLRLLAAVDQFAGRGRRGRGFLSDPTDSLTFSVALERPRVPGAPPLTGLPLALGVALAEHVAGLVDGVTLKWPNDLLREGRKCSGMLVETRTSAAGERVVIGLGVNLRCSPEIAARLDQPVAGLFDAQPDRMPVREVLLGGLARALIDAATGFFARGFSDTAARWARFDAFAGKEVSILEDGRRIAIGIAQGLDATGALLLKTDRGVIAVAAGDVSARAAATSR